MTSQQRFTFVNVTAPQEAASEANKKRIRSAAAASGWASGARPEIHQRLPETSQHPRFSYPVDLKALHDEPDKPVVAPNPRLTEREKKGSGASGTDANPASRQYPIRKFIWETSPSRKTSATKSGATEVAEESSILSNTKRKRTRRSSQLSTSRKSTPATLSSASTSSVSAIASPTTLVSSWTSSVQSPGTSLTTPNSALVSPHDLGSGIRDAFNCYPVNSQPWYDRVLHHMLTVFAPRGWPALRISNAEGLRWERFMTQHALADPALFNVRLLFASGDLIRLKVLSPDTALWLRDQAVRSINEALNDPVRAISDPLILAVGRIALHESMYGDKSAANLIHRPAQHRMIMMRGGMGTLDFPELVKRLMRWADRVMSIQSDTPRFLPDDDRSFSIDQSIEVLEKWVPREGLSLRQKALG